MCQAMKSLRIHQFGPGQWRRLARLAHAVGAMANTAHGFINPLALRRRRRCARFGLIFLQLIRRGVRAVNLLVEPAAVTIKIHRAKKHQHQRHR